MPAAIVTDAAGQVHTLTGPDGERVMHLARAAGLPVKGECEASLACATCHMIVDPDWAALLDPPSEAEEEMLDTVFGLAATSRLTCQIRLSPALDGIRLSLPG